MQFIVNLTSFDKRLHTTTSIAIKSLLNQEIQPDKIILWVEYGIEIPRVITELINYGLEIRHCKDYKSYNKLVHALQEYPNDILITADDDIYYPPDWFNQLKTSYLTDPNRIHVQRAHEIMINEKGELQNYKDWKFCSTQFDKEERIFPTGVAGILYPPKSLHREVLDANSFMSLAPKGDDIWFWAMACLQGTKYKIIENGYNVPKSIDPSDTGMWIENIYQQGNDIQLNAVFEAYPKLLDFLEQSLE